MWLFGSAATAQGLRRHSDLDLAVAGLPATAHTAALGVVEQVQDAQKNSTHTILPLGTLLNICPNRSSSTYSKARAALIRLQDLNAIPPLFSKEAEVLHRPEAMKATDWGSEASKTLVARYGPATKPFHVGLRKLAKEVLDRLGKSSDKDKLSVVANIRRKLRDYWRS